MVLSQIKGLHILGWGRARIIHVLVCVLEGLALDVRKFGIKEVQVGVKLLGKQV